MTVITITERQSRRFLVRIATYLAATALCGCNSQIARNREDARRELEIGRLAAARGEYSDAMKHIDVSLAVMPTDAAYHLKATVSLDAGDLGTAVNASTDGAAAFPASADLKADFDRMQAISAEEAKLAAVSGGRGSHLAYVEQVNHMLKTGDYIPGKRAFLEKIAARWRDDESGSPVPEVELED